MKNHLTHSSFATPLWDLFCTLSIIGIWPRFLEPNLILTSKLSLPIPNLHPSLQGFKILQISDLHLHPGVPNCFLKKIASKIKKYKPDLIAVTGDFLCYSRLTAPDKLRKMLQSFQAPFGCYAVFGNHDYKECVSINSEGEYDVISNSSSLAKAFTRLQESVILKKSITERAKNVPMHQELLNLLDDTPIKLLHNSTITLPIHDTKLNITGLGEYMLGRLDAKTAFKNYDANYPGIILLHNPDGAPYLKDFPGNIILCGHTHGGQVNLPWLWRKFTLLENMNFKKGLSKQDKKWVYVNRGIGSVIPFRWFSPPEILLLTLESQ